MAPTGSVGPPGGGASPPERAVIASLPPMSRALVLGGGGPVGIGWLAGLCAGLAAVEVRLAGADLVVGTSAGSVVGAQLSAGVDLAATVEMLAAAAAASHGTTTGLVTSGADEALAGLTALLAEAAGAGPAGAATRARIGRLACESPTVDEAGFLAQFAALAEVPWPEPFVCTAVDTLSGAFRVWDRSSGVELQRAVASSCAVPTIFPPVTMAGGRYMDGGLRDLLNADVALGHQHVLAVSCTVLELPEGFDEPDLAVLLASAVAQLDALRHGGAQLEVIVPGPEFLEVSDWGLSLMDFTRVERAWEAGLAQATVEADRLRPVWARPAARTGSS